jgi:pSer/pThr/pTyr-binding forkhead associated (FHA) protein
MNVRLICRAGPGRLEEFTLQRWPVLLGRGEKADIRLDDRWVSRQHCQICERNGVLLVKDLGSRHGTWLNHHRVDEAELHPGDELAVGITTLRVDC